LRAAVPNHIRENIKQRLWAKADVLGWAKLPDLERATWYEHWSKDREIGGVLSHFMDSRKIRVYIKDSLLKAYLRSRIEDDWSKVAALLGVPSDPQRRRKKFEKPHGVQMSDGKVVCWGHSRDWKGILMSAVERAFTSRESESYAAVLVETGATTDSARRAMIEEIGKRLGIAHIAWID
jgi:hypothetical protein